MQNIKKILPFAARMIIPAFLFLPLRTAEAGAPIIQILQEASHAVVTVKTESGGIQKSVSAPQGSKRGKRAIRAAKWTRLGAGVIIDPSGLIAANAHTVNKGVRITIVTAAQNVYPAKLIVLDTVHDLALLKIETPVPLPFLPLADSDLLTLKSTVYSIGSSSVLKNTLSEGRLTGIGVRQGTAPKSKNRQAQLLQVSFNVYPGDSGSPVLDSQGALVGIISGATPRRGKTAYAVPSNFIAKASSGVLARRPLRKGS